MILLAALTALAMDDYRDSESSLSAALGRRKWCLADRMFSILMATALFVSLIGGVAYDALLAQGEIPLDHPVYILSSALQMLLLLALLHSGMWIAPLVTLIVCGIWGSRFWANVGTEMRLSGRKC